MNQEQAKQLWDVSIEVWQDLESQEPYQHQPTLYDEIPLWMAAMGYTPASTAAFLRRWADVIEGKPDPDPQFPQEAPVNRMGG